MKKILIAVVGLTLASPVMAGVGVEFGTDWYKVNYTNNVGDHLMGQGQNILVFWGLDNDLTLGAYVERGILSDGTGGSYTNNLMAIQIAKGLVKNVSVGLKFGQGRSAYADLVLAAGSGQIPFTDVFASVVIMSGSSDKILGTVKATVASRFSREIYMGSNMDFGGIVVNLSVGLGI